MAGRKKERRIVVEPVRRKEPDLRRLARVLIELAIAAENDEASQDDRPAPAEDGGRQDRGAA